MHTMHIERRRDRRALATEAGYGSVSWVSVLAGTLAAYGLTAALLAIAGGIAAAINNGSDFSHVAPGDLKLSSAIIIAVALFVSYLFGGYVAGRMARRSGLVNGVGVFVLGVIVAVAIGVWVKEAGGGRGLASTLHDVGAPNTWHEWRAVGSIAGAAALVAMLIGSMIGGADGEAWHTKLMRRALDPTVGPDAHTPSRRAEPAVAAPAVATPVADEPVADEPVAERAVDDRQADPAVEAERPGAEGSGSGDRRGWRHLLHH